MALMTNMREYTKTILIIVVLAFVGTIIFDWGMNLTGSSNTRSGVIGKVEGREITSIQFTDAYTAEIESLRNQTGSEPTEGQLASIRNRVWDSLVQNILIQKALRERDITVEDHEIVYRIFNDPPADLKSSPLFQNEQNQFDMAKYQAALSDPTIAGQWRPIEEYLRRTLPLEKFQQRLQASVRVTDDEVKREYLKQNQQAKVKYLFFDQNKFKDTEAEIPEDDIKSYYNRHKEDYREEEKRKIEYVFFPTSPTKEDSSEQYNLAQEIIGKINDGDDFAELAEYYSEDPASKDKGGDLGYFDKGTMVKEFGDAAFGTPVGSVAGPVKTQFGLHIIKVEDKKVENDVEKISARHILLKFVASRKTINNARDDADYFADEAENTSFMELAKEYNRSAQKSGLFPKGTGYVPGLGLNKRASNFIFSNDISVIGEVVETDRRFIVFRITEIQKERIKPLDEVTETIKNSLKSEQRLEMAGEAAQKIYARIKDAMAFEEVADQDSLKIKETSQFTRSGFVSGVGREPKFIGAAFTLPQIGDISKPIAATRGYYIIQLTERDEFDANDFDNKKEQIRNQLMQSKQGQVFANWYSVAKDNADIDDRRDNLF